MLLTISLFEPKRKIRRTTDVTWKARYSEASKKYQALKYPNAVKDHGHIEPKYPKVDTANGLTTAIVNYLNWNGHKADRISTTGQARRFTEKGFDVISGEMRSHSHVGFVKGNTTKGKADISATLRLPHLSAFGISADFEVKVGRDRHREEQKKEMAKMKAVGGFYFLIRTIEDFFFVYDELQQMKP